MLPLQNVTNASTLESCKSQLLPLTIPDVWSSVWSTICLTNNLTSISAARSSACLCREPSGYTTSIHVDTSNTEWLSITTKASSRLDISLAKTVNEPFTDCCCYCVWSRFFSSEAIRREEVCTSGLDLVNEWANPSKGSDHTPTRRHSTLNLISNHITEGATF